MDRYDRVMKRVYKFYDNPKVEETYALDYSLVRMIIPRLKLFIEKSELVIDWDEHTKYSNIDVMQTCRDIIEDFEYYLAFDDKSSTINNPKDELDLYRECQTRAQHGFELLGRVISHLGW